MKLNKNNDNNYNLDELSNIEPKIISNNYYDNYPKNKFSYKENNYDDYKYFNSNNPYKSTKYNNVYDNKYNDSNQNINYTYNFLKKLLILSNIEGNFVKIFSVDKLWIPILMFIKKILLSNVKPLNKYIFKEKISSLTITYTHFTSTYYNQQNNTSDYLIYKSILLYTYDKKIVGSKFTSNSNSNLMFFDQFEEIQITKSIWLTTKNTTSNTSTIYTLELSSYTTSIDSINRFIKKCLEKYKPKIQYGTLSGLKYYKYIGMNNSTHQCMYDEYLFTQTKTFSNIFFTNKKSLVHKIKYFSKNPEIYKLMGRPYTMGIMLYGKPGTGKTSCIKAIASLTKRNIIEIPLTKIKTQKELSDIFYGNKINGVEIGLNKRLYVFEEFDCIIDRLKDRKLFKNITLISNEDKTFSDKNNLENLKNSSNYYTDKIKTNNFNENNSIKEIDDDVINLDSLLCLLDGTVELSGSMFIATTNYIDLIDKALIRPGRFDCCVEFDNASEEIIIQMINHFSDKNLQKLKNKKKHLSTSNISTNKTTSTTEYFNELSQQQIEVIKKYSTFNGKYVWSPAKISHICLFHMGSINYYDDVINDIVKQYDDECKLL